MLRATCSNLRSLASSSSTGIQSQLILWYPVKHILQNVASFHLLRQEVENSEKCRNDSFHSNSFLNDKSTLKNKTKQNKPETGRSPGGLCAHQTPLFSRPLATVTSDPTLLVAIPTHTGQRLPALLGTLQPGRSPSRLSSPIFPIFSLSQHPHAILSPAPTYQLCPSLQQRQRLPALPETKETGGSSSRLPVNSSILPVSAHPTPILLSHPSLHMPTPNWGRDSPVLPETSIPKAQSPQKSLLEYRLPTLPTGAQADSESPDHIDRNTRGNRKRGTKHPSKKDELRNRYLAL